MPSEVWKEWVDIADTTTAYFGFAPYTVAADEAGWLVKRIIRIDGDCTEQWSGDRPNAIWNERTTITYV